jgi:hypothetical protein
VSTSAKFKETVDLDRVIKALDAVNADRPLRSKTLHDCVRAERGEIKLSTLFRNITRRADAQQVVTSKLTPD